MKFAKIVFLVAGVYGVIAIAPMYFMEQMLSENAQKVFNHPVFFYGFLGVTLSWQIAFLVSYQGLMPRFRFTCCYLCQRYA